MYYLISHPGDQINLIFIINIYLVNLGRPEIIIIYIFNQLINILKN